MVTCVHVFWVCKADLHVGKAFFRLELRGTLGGAHGLGIQGTAATEDDAKHEAHGDACHHIVKYVFNMFIRKLLYNRVWWLVET